MAVGQESPETLGCNFHGIGLHIAADPALRAALSARLGLFPPAVPDMRSLTFKYWDTPAATSRHLHPAPASARPVYTSPIGEALYSDERDELYIHCLDGIQVVCRASTGQTDLWMERQADENLWLLSHPLFTLPLIEQLKRRGLYSLHAAGMALNGTAVLFAGASGSGKSTLALALLRAGFAFLGDDMLFLAPGKDHVRICAFPEAIDATDQTLCLFSQLDGLRETPHLPGSPKRQLAATSCFGARIAWQCRPALLIFPHVAHTAQSMLQPMDAEEALLELAPNVLLTETRSSQAHLDALADLVDASACYRLETGRDFAALAVRLRELLER